MLRFLIGLLGVVFAVFLLFGGSGSKVSDRAERQEAFATPFGIIYAANRGKDIARTVMNADAFTRYRRASVTLVWPERALGSSRAERLRRLEGMAQFHAEAECKLLLRAFAGHCRVAEARPNLWGDAAQLRVELEFIPRQQPRMPQAAGDLQIHVMELSYPQEGRHKAADSEKGASDRLAMYFAIARDCREAASLYGNCLLHNVTIYGSLYGEAGSQYVGVSGFAIAGIVRPRTFTQ